jgi:hypothetical protein
MNGLFLSISHDTLTLPYKLDDERYDDRTRDLIDRAARHLYGLIHARFVITTRGLAKMVSECYI